MYEIKKMEDGIELIEFKNNCNFKVIFSNYGASIYELYAPDKNGVSENVVLTPSHPFYFRNDKYCGLTVARVAGRFGKGEYKINGKKQKLPKDSNGNTLHSGDKSISYAFFNSNVKEDGDKTIITYSIFVKDMEDNFPGDLELNVVYTLYNDKNVIGLEYQSVSSKDSVLNLTNHSYFNLSGELKRDVLDHELTVNANLIGCLDDKSILRGVREVEPEFDFRKPKVIGKDAKTPIVSSVRLGYDDYFITTDDRIKINLYDIKSGRNLYVESDYKNVVLYTNNYPNETIFTNGVKDKGQIAIAIEPCRFVDILEGNGLTTKARKLYVNHITYTFTTK